MFNLKSPRAEANYGVIGLLKALGDPPLIAIVANKESAGLNFSHSF
ncbi:hypothetical protein SAMN05660413_01365 [Salegentibacter flavus]|uniref:Uncharacterized protein n=1 Tax=Salegentibacter flavus TaxID=287099 RepID=A0A1I4ZJ46_9FLAO|nr:hypothetical protein SAMN05660413_01365 [Salegentibacter flavus]